MIRPTKTQLHTLHMDIARTTVAQQSNTVFQAIVVAPTTEKKSFTAVSSLRG